MTKLEAWKAWCATAGTEQLANPFTLENSSHGKAFSYAWAAAHEACAKVCDDHERQRCEAWAKVLTTGGEVPSASLSAVAAAIRARKTNDKDN